MLYLNQVNQVISWRHINTGTGMKVDFDIKFALACGLNCMATKIVIAHNHPYGYVTPSNDDIRMTQKLFKATQLLDIQLVDHIIMAPDTYFSFKDHDVFFK